MNITAMASRLALQLSNPKSSDVEQTPPNSGESGSISPAQTKTSTTIVEYLAPSSPAEQDYLAKLLPALKKELNPDLENALYLAGQFHQRNSIVQPAIMVQNLFLDTSQQETGAQLKPAFHSVQLFQPNISNQLLNQTISAYDRVVKQRANSFSDQTFSLPIVDFLR